MSSSIIYHMVGMLMPTTLTGHDQDLVLIAAQVGESNCFEFGSNGRDGRRSRSWSALHWGTPDEVLTDIIQTAGGFEGGGLKLDSARGNVTPEFYIGRGKRILKQAQSNNLAFGPVPFKDGHVYANLLDRTGDMKVSLYWTDREAVCAYMARIRSEPMTHRPYYYLDVSGPELRH